MTPGHNGQLMKVERLLAKRTKKDGPPSKVVARPKHVIVEELKDKEGKVQYLAKWRGYSWRSCVWLNEEELYDARLIEEYEKRVAVHQARLRSIKPRSGPMEQAGQASNKKNEPSQPTRFDDDSINMNGSSSFLEECFEVLDGTERDETNALDNSPVPTATGSVQLSPTTLSIPKASNRSVLSHICEEDDPISVGFEYPLPKGYLNNEMEGDYERSPERILKELEIAGVKVKQTSCYFTSPAKAKLSSFRKLLVLKYDLPPPFKIEIAYGRQLLPEHYSLRDIVNLFLEGQKKYLHFYFRVIREHAEDPDEHCLLGEESLD